MTTPAPLHKLRQVWLDTGTIDALDAFLAALDAAASERDLDPLDPPPDGAWLKMERTSSAVAAVLAAVAFMVMVAGIAWLALDAARTATP